MNFYFAAKALHIIGFVCWFAGLFYGVRLFIYWREAGDVDEPLVRGALQAQLGLMSRRLWYIIAWPAMVITLVFGLTLAIKYWGFGAGWLRMKLGLVGALVGYHLVCQRLLAQLSTGACSWSSRQLRMWNEVATLLLVAIVFVAVFKSLLSVAWGVGGMLGFAVVLMIAIRLYARVRR